MSNYGFMLALVFQPHSGISVICSPQQTYTSVFFNYYYWLPFQLFFCLQNTNCHAASTSVIYLEPVKHHQCTIKRIWNISSLLQNCPPCRPENILLWMAMDLYQGLFLLGYFGGGFIPVPPLTKVSGGGARGTDFYSSVLLCPLATRQQYSSFPLVISTIMEFNQRLYDDSEAFKNLRLYISIKVQSH